MQQLPQSRPLRTFTQAGAAALALAGLLAGAAGCASPPATNPVEPRQNVTPSSTPSPSAEPTGRAGDAAGVPLSRLKLRLEPVASGFKAPLFVTHAGDSSGRLFVVEQGGLVQVLRNGRKGPKPFLDVRSKISSGGERGLLGLAFAQDYETSGRFYVDYTDTKGNTIVARYTAQDPASDSPGMGAPEIVLTVQQPYPNHNGGCLAWAPDGTLWVGMGDGGAGGDPQNRAQNKRERLGKLLALDVEGADKPVPKMVALGLRNPWRFSFDRQTNALWIGDVGQNAWEEIDYVPWDTASGRNFGWNRWEGNHPYPPGGKSSRRGFTFPAIEYGHDQGDSVTGGYVYRGTRYPALVGTYLYADFGSGRVWGARTAPKSGGAVASRLLLADSGTSPSSFGEDAQGEVYLVDYNGRIMRVAGEAR